MDIPVGLEVTPKVFLAGREADVTVRVRAPGPGGGLRLRLLSMAGTDGRLCHPAAGELARVPRDGMVTVRCHLPTEQEYVFRLEGVSPDSPPLATARAYAVGCDLFSRLPWKGDLHMHSNRSDGKDEPAEVMAACRRIGLDFAALTDHHVYEPSLEAIRAFERCPTDLVMLPGEEVHPPNNPVHIVNAGGRRSVNAMFGSNCYAAEVADLERELGEENPRIAPEDRAQLASAIWCFRRVRGSGGLGIFCHPYWVSRSRWDVPGTLTNMLLGRLPFDALELIGGYHVHEAESNVLQVARWADERARGIRMPVVGVSDAHGCHTGKLFGWYYTIAFAPDPTWNEVLPAIHDEWSVAVEARPGEAPRAFGSYRLVMYSLFLLREVFPAHDALCAEEGELMSAWARGEREAGQTLAGLRGRVRALYRELWAPPA